MGVEYTEYDIMTVDIIINEFFKGFDEDHLKLHVVANNLDSCPDFRPGDRFIFYLKKYIKYFKVDKALIL